MSKLKPPVNPGDHHLGNTDALITLVEFGDFECPHCGRAHPFIKRLLKENKDLHFVFRNFPLTQVHPHAQHAAEAAESAAAQRKFWEMHDYLYEHQQVLDDEHLAQYAAILGLDLPKFVQDISHHVHAAHIREDFLSGIRSGVNGTPTFFINGIRYNDSWDLETLLERLNYAIKEHL